MGQQWTAGEPELYAIPDGCWVWPPQVGCQKVGLMLTVPQGPQSQHLPSPLSLSGQGAAEDWALVSLKDVPDPTMPQASFQSCPESGLRTGTVSWVFVYMSSLVPDQMSPRLLPGLLAEVWWPGA